MKVIWAKPPPLIPISTSNDAIKPINRRKIEEREEEIQATISPKLRRQISISKAPWVRKWKRNTMGSRDSRRLVSKQLN